MSTFQEYLIERTAKRCDLCRELPEDILQQVTNNEYEAKPERQLMLDWLEKVAPRTPAKAWTRDNLYAHRMRCMGLPRSGQAAA